MGKRREEPTLEEMIDHVKRYEQRQKQRIRSINIDNLQQGIDHLFKYVMSKKPSWWRGDFHNSLYQSLENQRRRGLNEDLWRFLAEVIKKWRAYRPTPVATINERGLERLERLRAHYAPLSTLSAQLGHGLSLNWRDVSPLFQVAAEIKPVENDSPVFPSKLCHFLCPSIYPVFDNTLVKIGLIEYEVYWDKFKEQCEEVSEVGALIQELKGRFPEAPCDHYPWATKIFEFCQY